MEFGYNDYFEDDDYSFGAKIDGRELSEALDYPSLISYRYIQIEETDYHLRDPKTPKKVKAVAASALTQASDKKKKK